MIPDKLKKCIFDKFYKDLKNVEIISYENCLWFIDRKNRYWYLEYQKTGHLWWRYQYFTDFFRLFSFERDKFEPIIKDWVEEVLNHKVLSTNTSTIIWYPVVGEVLNHKVLSTTIVSSFSEQRVEEVLNHKVLSTYMKSSTHENRLENVLNCKVLEMSVAEYNPDLVMDEILESKFI